jgi:dephospho-CoA kinase
MSSILIGLIGKAGAGKDTIADNWVAKNNFVRIAFADKLKQIIAEVYDVPFSYFNERDLKNVPHENLSGAYLLNKIETKPEILLRIEEIFSELGMANKFATHWERIFINLLPKNCSPRLAAQLIGTEGFRSIETNVWFDYAFRITALELAKGNNVAISDVRFSNEFDGIHYHNGTTVGISRNNGTETYTHASEAEVDALVNKSDFIIANNGTISDLLKKSRKVLNSLQFS